ncbi:uncharacterized protein KY384_007051 [Bacidia gigantensis]|uniref:uncharacterized protein n=1 Tax=Bacidia gigantensis TaxID=2732470 RepID=UPI001D03D77D|nr:uncharacterized protein KY384_007051 [Bacidia gigantensis]KAG8528135.1 hypothetical protein KY384_007051 [Bacidia gigantensis]
MTPRPNRKNVLLLNLLIDDPERNTYLDAPRPFYSCPQLRQQAAAAAVSEAENDGDAGQTSGGNGPVTQFKELAERGMVCKTVVDTLTQDMGLESMTEVQSLTINETLKGTDTLAQARTGTGKTLAFLIPVLQNIIRQDPSLEQRMGSRSSAKSTDIRAIIISPTRELAEQIAVEAKRVTRNTGVMVQTAVGGSHKASGLRNIQRLGCHILIGTPGRLKDILSDRYSQVQAPNLSAFVLDEADRLLDQGFAPDIQDIQSHLPKRQDVDRQTLLYSATVPKEIMQIVRATMKKDFRFVRTVKQGEQQTHERVPQKLVNVGDRVNQMPALVELCIRELQNSTQEQPFKAIVYFGTTADVSLAAAIIRRLQPRSFRDQKPSATSIPQSTSIIEMHARLSQPERTRASSEFRQAQSAILLSSDVTARGMDFPNVTHIIQVGLPPSEEQYVHRIGRTARAGKTGVAWLLITDLEVREASFRLPDMPLKDDQSLETPQVRDIEEDVPGLLNATQISKQVIEATRSVPAGLKSKAYAAALGVNQWMRNKQRLIDSLNRVSEYSWGLTSPPGISRMVVQRLGLAGIQGLNIESRPPPSGQETDLSGFRDRSGQSGYRNAPRQGYSPRGRGGSQSFDSRSNRGSQSGFGDRRGGSSGFGRDNRQGNRSFERYE